jgi:hypothetical protein
LENNIDRFGELLVRALEEDVLQDLVVVGGSVESLSSDLLLEAC